MDTQVHSALQITGTPNTIGKIKPTTVSVDINFSPTISACVCTCTMYMHVCTHVCTLHTVQILMYMYIATWKEWHVHRESVYMCIHIHVHVLLL